VVKAKAFLLDMDGVLYHGDNVLPGARDFVKRIQAYPHCFVTNNPMRTPAAIAQRLQQLGFPNVDASSIITSAMATRLWLQQQASPCCYYAVGGEALQHELEKIGSQDAEQADFVVVGEGYGLDFDSLTTGINLILNGAQLVGTNPDACVNYVHKGKPMVLPGGGALLAPFAVATGVTPVIIGKPEPLLFQLALQQLQMQAQDCVMIGDRPDTDIHGAAQLGIQTALVRTGQFAAGERYPEALLTPTWDVLDLASLAEQIF